MKRAVGIAFIVIGLTTALGYFYLIDHYARSLPRSPRPELGRVLELNDHGTIVFVTRSESWTLTWLQWSALTLSICGGLLIKFGNKTGKERSSLPP